MQILCSVKIPARGQAAGRYLHVIRRADDLVSNRQRESNTDDSGKVNAQVEQLSKQIEQLTKVVQNLRKE